MIPETEEGSLSNGIDTRNMSDTKAARGLGWQRCFGGSIFDRSGSIYQTVDGGYIVAGRTDSNDRDVIGNHGAADAWVVKLDSTGAKQWQKCLGGSNFDWTNCIQQTRDGGYVVAGSTGSNDGDVIGNHGVYDFWVVKLDSIGAIKWQKCLGGSGDDEASCIQQTTDGGYIVTGYTYSFDRDVSGNHGMYDCWVVRLDSTGAIKWQKCLGGSGDDRASCIQQTTDGGYIVAGQAYSNDGDVSGKHEGVGYDFWVVKLDSGGDIKWQKCLGGNSSDDSYSIQQTADSGYIVAGSTDSNDGDVIGNHGMGDYWVVKLNSTGAIKWQKCLGGSSSDDSYSIQQTTDGGYIVAGQTNSNDGDVSGNNGDTDLWVVKLTGEDDYRWDNLGGYITSSPFMIKDSQDRTHIFARGGDNALWDNIDGVWQELGGYITSDPYAVRDNQGQIHTFVRGGDNSLWDNVNGSWHPLGGYILSNLSAVVVPSENRLKIAAKGGDNALWINDLDTETLTGSWLGLGGYITSNPYLIYDSQGAMHAFVRGGDGALWENANDNWISRGGYITSDAKPIFDPKSSVIRTFARGGDGSLWSHANNAGWSSLGGFSLPASGSIPYKGNPEPVTGTNQDLRGFVRGGDSALWVNLNGHWYYRGHAITSDASAMFDSATDSVHIAVRENDGALWVCTN